MKKREYIQISLIIFMLGIVVAVIFVKCGGPAVIQKNIRKLPSAGHGRAAAEVRADYLFTPSKKLPDGAANCGIWVVKIDTNGEKQWEKTYTGRYYEWADFIVPVKDGGYVIASKSYTFGEDYDGVSLMKIDAKGNPIWSKKFDKSAEAEFSEPLQNGSLVAGRTYSGDNKSYGVFIAKADMKGDYTYMKTFGSDYLSWGYTAIATVDGHFVTTGVAEEYRNTDNANVYLIKRDTKGTYSWVRKFGNDNYCWGYSVAQSRDGGFLVSGLIFSGVANDDDFYVIKTDADGNSVWARTYGGAGADRAYDGIQAQDGGYIIAGATSSFGAGGYDAYIVKTDAYGNTVWAKTYGGTGDESAHSIAATKDGGYIFAGATNSTNR
jgi:hypothetical protein